MSVGNDAHLFLNVIYCYTNMISINLVCTELKTAHTSRLITQENPDNNLKTQAGGSRLPACLFTGIGYACS
ncbi:MAG: hypothetical protein ACRDDP_05595, partial [Plesiomonas sp.]